jgi:Cysteine rich repeat
MRTESACKVATLAAVLAVMMMGPGARPAGAQTPGQDTQALMQSELGQQVLNGCNAELVQHCAEVTPGEGRLLACLYAHGDKLSGQCEFALYDAAARLERAISGSPMSPANAARSSRPTARTCSQAKAALPSVS